ncbi:MAG: ComF family protein [Ruminococcaceae bacterium]|nr:ComF family protein [Oscillospiraceae bacterium]
MKPLTDILAGLFGAAKCPLCGGVLRHPGDSLCVNCLRTLVRENTRVCGECGEPAVTCGCTPEGFAIFTELAGRRMCSHCFYTGWAEEEPDLTAKLVYTAKQRNNRRLYRFVIGFLAADIRDLFDRADEDLQEWICTFPPRSAKGYRKYGFDQGEEMARLLASELNIPFRPLFVKRAGIEQKTAADTAERRENMEKSLFIKPGTSLTGCKILLFDDIITTGSTVIRAAGLLYENGAESVFPVSYARTKHYIKPKTK